MMSEDQTDLLRLWRRLSDNQRLHLVGELPGVKPHGNNNFVVAGRALERHGLFRPPQGHNGFYSVGSKLTAKGATLARHAVEQGWAQQTDSGWQFSAGPQPRRSGTIDPNRLAELAASGLYGAQIARQLGVSHEAVRQAAIRQQITLPPRPKKPRPKKPRPQRQPRIPRPERIVFNVSADELASIKQAATQSRMPVAEYVRRAALAPRWVEAPEDAPLLGGEKVYALKR